MSINPCIPENLPIASLDYRKYVRLVGQANAELARFDGLLQTIVNPAVLLSPMSTNEAVLSSKIEGTQATLQEVLSFEAKPDIKNTKYDEIFEILNYRKAMTFAFGWLVEKRPINLSMLKQTHKILLTDVRGKDKTPGEFRTTQNWIGSHGTNIGDARFVPPSPLIIQDYLENFEQYLVYDEVDPLIQMAIIHAQFEIIHPFNDVGRMLIPLFLFQKGMIASPMFYISEYLEENRKRYVNELLYITDNKNWDNWVVFFLEAIMEQAKRNTKKTKAILSLYEEMKKSVQDITRSQFTINIVDTLFKMPIFNTADFITNSNIPKPSAGRFLNLLVNNEILEVMEKGKGRIPNIYVFKNLYEIVK
jgi:filamentation induced by cAMP protein fic